MFQLLHFGFYSHPNHCEHNWLVSSSGNVTACYGLQYSLVFLSLLSLCPRRHQTPICFDSNGLERHFSESYFSETWANVRLFLNPPHIVLCILGRWRAENLCSFPLKETGASVAFARTDPNTTGDVLKRNVWNCGEFLVNTQPGRFRHWLHAERKRRGWRQITRDWAWIKNSLRKLLTTCTCGGMKSKVYHINYFWLKKNK